MKKSLLFCALIAIASAGTAFARINLLEPWHPGLDSAVGLPASYTLRGAVVSGGYGLEVPAEFDYVTAQKIEVGGRWGLREHSGNVGLNDLMIGGKYVFFDETDQSPSVLGEAAFSLPTGRFSDGLGTGSMDFLLHWASAKKLSEDYNGTFGLGIRLNSENSDKYSAGNVFFYHIGVSRRMEKDMTLYGELKGFNHGKSKLNTTEQDDDYQELYLAPGIDYTLDSTWTLNGALLIGLTSRSDNLGLIVSTKFK